MNTKKKLAIALLVASTTWRGLLAQSAAPTSPAPDRPAPADEEIIELSPFEVTSKRDTGYQATETLAGTRIRTDLKDVGSAITVITREFLQDVGATDNSTLLQYTPNAEVAGTRGTYTGLGHATSVDETATLRAPSIANGVRGLAAADNTRDFFVTDIPWDSYNVDRVDIQRGPNSIVFGLGSPAGIVNASTRNAELRDRGDVTFRTGSYGSMRGSIDINQDIIHNVLALRIDGLWNSENFKQEQAFQDDQRVYGALRFDPQIFADRTWRTSFKARYENGEIEANGPRIVPPSDSITPWFRPVDNTRLTGGMGKLAVNTAYEIGSNPAAANPWLTAGIANQQQPIWFIDGTTNQTYRIYGGYINSSALNNNGTNRGAGNSAIGQRYSDQFYGLNSLSTFATNARAPGYQYGQYRQQSLMDPTIFDFYHNLIDGPTSSQFEKWDAYNLDFSQTACDDRLGLQLTYDRQKYKRGGQSLLANPALTIDVLKNFQDLTPNPNFGRPYIAGGPGNGSSYESDRKYTRASLFGELRARDLFRSEFLVKLLGKHRLNGVYSGESYATENRSWQMYANRIEWTGYWNQTNGTSSSFRDRPPVTAIYLGPTLAHASSAAGANFPGIQVPVELQNGGVYSFNATWKNPVGVCPADSWAVPSNLLPIFDPAVAITQASNPANYVGWNSNFLNNLLRYNNGQDERLTTVAQKSLRKTKSYAGSWQGFLWNEAIVPTFGWRYDEVKGKNVTGAPVTSNRSMLNLSPDVYRLPDQYPQLQTFKDHSTASGIVVHLNKLFGDRDPLPINVSLSYNKANNFQVTDTRRNVYGTPIGNPTGATKDYGVLLSTKDGKYSLRAVKE